MYIFESQIWIPEITRISKVYYVEVDDIMLAQNILSEQTHEATVGMLCVLFNRKLRSSRGSI